MSQHGRRRAPGPREILLLLVALLTVLLLLVFPFLH